MGRIVMGYWDCPYCGKSNIPGNMQSCTGCGRTRDGSVKFHPPGQSPSTPKVYVTDPDKADRLRNSPDWHCSFCGGMVNHYQSQCPNCGHTRDESDRHYFQLHPERKTTIYPASDSSSPSADGEEHHRSTSASSSFSAGKNSFHLPKRSNFSSSIPWKRIGIILLIISLVTGVAVGAWFIFSPKERYITVTDIYWSRAIDIEEYRTVRESDWSVPPGGRVQYTQQEIHHYDRVLDHYDTVTKYRQVVTGSHEEVTGYRDMGNGYYEEITRTVYDYGTEPYTEQEPVYRNDPVYRTKYYYDIERWMYDYTVRSGAHDKQPYWPEYTLEDDKHRAGSKSQSYNITAVYEDKSDNYSMNYNDWIETSIDDQLHVLVHFGGRIELIQDEGGE
ncbi:hypothetical protein IJM16_01525 [Candidatus Saccharibacteria bacterium]|nr:hypothetical protein [Candidatus Saccharibacteria bacterium]